MLKSKQEMSVKGATVPFYTYMSDNMDVIEFDSTNCVAPEPMLNAMLGLELLVSEKMKLVMFNRMSPVGLYAKIDKYFDIKEDTLEDGRVKLEIFYKKGISDKADLSDKTCHG